MGTTATTFDGFLVTATGVLESALVEYNTGTAQIDTGTVIAARRLVDLAELVCTRAVASLAADHPFNADGYADCGSWLAANTHARQYEAVTRSDHDQILRLLPTFAAVLHSGHVGIGHLRLLTNALTTERKDTALEQENFLVDAAKTLSVSQFGQFMNHWVALCDDLLNDPTAGDEQHLPKRSLTIHELSTGMWRLTGNLDPLSGEIVRAALEAAMPKPATDDTRTAPQRRHDALIDLCAESLKTSDRPVVGGERPNVTVHIDASTGLAYTPQRFYLSNITRDMVLCDANITSVWLDTTGKPFDVGTPTSDIPARNRKAVIARDQHCRYPGCGRPNRWTEIHHITYREHGGCHSIDNLVTLCRYHHRLTHKHRLALTWDGDQPTTLNITWPNGTTIHSPPTPSAKPPPINN